MQITKQTEPHLPWDEPPTANVSSQTNIKNETNTNNETNINNQTDRAAFVMGSPMATLNFPRQIEIIKQIEIYINAPSSRRPRRRPWPRGRGKYIRARRERRDRLGVRGPGTIPQVFSSWLLTQCLVYIHNPGLGKGKYIRAPRRVHRRRLLVYPAESWSNPVI